MINESTYIEIDNLLSAFSFNALQELTFILTILEKNNFAMDDFRNYFVTKQKNIESSLKQQNDEFIKQHTKWQRKANKCEDCGTVMNLYRVNTSQRDNIGGNYKSQWFCPECLNAEYNEISYEELYSQIMNN